MDHKTGSHFIFYDPKNKRRAVAPFHVKDLPKGIILNILSQAGITKEELEKFYNLKFASALRVLGLKFLIFFVLLKI